MMHIKDNYIRDYYVMHIIAKCSVNVHHFPKYLYLAHKVHNTQSRIFKMATRRALFYTYLV